MHLSHYKTVCSVHGTVLSQCRCMGPKVVRSVPCPGPPMCGATVIPLPEVRHDYAI
jgi:hypothetical protein